MAHPEQLQFVRAVSEHLSTDYAGKRVLEIGSYDVNGSIRPLFRGSSYVGVDLTEGPGVDLVCAGDAIDHPDDSYELTISCECFEHNPHWRETFLNMHRMTKPGGVVLFTCATTGRLEHGTARTLPKSSPGSQGAGWNYYRNLTERDFRSRLAMDQLFDGHFFLVDRTACDLYFVGSKKGGPGFHFDAQKLREQCRSEADERLRKNRVQPRRPMLRAIALAPMRIAARLPDRHYQNFAFRYLKLIKWLRLKVS
jgi:SAM-dependent methyltransferase